MKVIQLFICTLHCLTVYNNYEHFSCFIYSIYIEYTIFIKNVIALLRCRLRIHYFIVSISVGLPLQQLRDVSYSFGSEQFKKANGKLEMRNILEHFSLSGVEPSKKHLKITKKICLLWTKMVNMAPLNFSKSFMFFKFNSNII